MSLNLKENVKLRRRVDKDVFAYISMKDSHPNISKNVEAGIIFPYHMDGGIRIFG